MQVRRHATRLVAAAVLAAGLAGCAGDPVKPAPYTPSAVTSSSPAASPTPSTPPPSADAPIPPPLPDPSKYQTVAGAEAFAEYYWQMVNYAQTSQDLAPLRTLGTATCAGCRREIEGLRQVFGEGGTFKGGAYTATALSVKTSHVGGHPAYDVILNLAAEPGTVAYPRTTRDGPTAQRHRIRMTVSWARRAWYVEYWGNE
jgi:hypothetical protein